MNKADNDCATHTHLTRRSACMGPLDRLTGKGVNSSEICPSTPPLFLRSRVGDCWWRRQVSQVSSGLLPLVRGVVSKDGGFKQVFL